ncbi:unnamed protein product, partial [Closterium sp. NIES-54]
EFKLYHGKGGLYIGKVVLKSNVFVLDFVPDLGTADSDAIVNFADWTHPPDLDPDFSLEGFWYSHTIPEAERTRALVTIQHSAAAETPSAAEGTTRAAATTTPVFVDETPPTPAQQLHPTPREVHRSVNFIASFYSNSDMYRRSPGHRTDESTWHARMGHASNTVLNNTIRAGVLDKDSLLLLDGRELQHARGTCLTCPEADLPHRPFAPRHNPSAPAYAPLEKVYSDILYNREPGQVTYNYTITFIDAATGGLTERRESASRPASPVRTIPRVPRPRPPPVSATHAMALRPSSVPLHVPLPAPPESSLPEVPDPESDRARAASPTISRLLATVVTNPSFESTAASALVAELVDFAIACRLDYATALVAGSECSSPPSVGGECALGTDVLEDRQEKIECLAAAVPRFVSMLLAPEGDSDAPDIPTPCTYVEAITGLYSSQWQAAMDAEMASWKSTGTYVEVVPPPRANIVDGMWIFRVKRPPGSPPAFKARYVARGFSQRQGVDYFQTFSPTLKMTTLRVLLHVAAQHDYELRSLDFSTAFLQGSLHDEIWLRRPPGLIASFPAGTQWSLRRPVYGLRQAPRESHDTLRTTLAALGFTPSTADPSLFLCTDMSLPPFYVLVNVDGLIFATTIIEALTLVLQRFGFQFSLPQPTPLSTIHFLSAPPSDKSVEPSGPYPELVGCLMYLMTCTRPDLAYRLSLLARYVAPGRHQKVHWDAAKRVLRYLCSTSGMGLVLGGRGPVVLTSHADASWVDDSATQRPSQGYTFSPGFGSVSWWSTRSSSVLSSSCEAEIYAGAMAAQELRWLTYLLTDLGERPFSPLVLYVDNKAMIALCQEHRLEHRTKNIALRYFLARELQQHGQPRLAYMATRANTADRFTNALPPGDHQLFSTVLGLVPTLPHLLTA